MSTLKQVFERFCPRETRLSLVAIKMGPLAFRDVGFCGGRKTGEPGEKPSEYGENHQQTHYT